MSNQGWVETLVSAAVDGPALTASTTATSLIPTAKKWTLGNQFWSVEKVLRVSGRGRISNIVTTPGTLTLDVRLGAVIAFNGGAIPLNTTAKTNVSFEFEVDLVCRTIGAGTAATVLGIGSFTAESVFGSPVGAANSAMLPASAPAAGSGFDATSALTVDIFGAWSLSNANSIQLHHFMLQSLN